jgi:hypothetical protein
MSGSTTEAEETIDQHLAELESPGRSVRGNAFSRLLQRMHLRNEYENVAIEYLSLLRKGSGSRLVGLKVLHVLDLMRARDIGLQAVRFAPIGRNKRQPWSLAGVRPEYPVLFSSQWQAESSRTLRSAKIPFPTTFNPPPNPDAVDLNERDATGTNILDLSDVVILHLGFVGDGLVIALDSNLERFFYGSKVPATDRRVRAEAFADYGYQVHNLEPDGVIFGPVVRPGIRSKVIAEATRLHQQFDRKEITTESLGLEVHFQSGSTYPSSEVFRSIMGRLENLLGYEEIIDSLQKWAHRRNRSLEDICLVILPDEALFLLPLSFLGGSQAEPLITKLGGVSISLGLIGLKWAAYEYHWATLPNRSAGSPRCALFAANGIPRLDLCKEQEVVSTAFGAENCRIRGEYVSRIDFFNGYSAGDVCWFAGHGLWDDSHGILVNEESLPFPLSGPAFSDGPVTNWDLIATSNWNFKAMWLTVMNSCLLGRSVLVGPNPLGFISAMHCVGSVASVAALWPVVDEAAICFAENMAREIVANFHKTDFPRARALSKAIRMAIGHDEKRQWLFAPYALWGLP